MRKTNAKKYPKPRMELCSDPKVKICPLPVRRDAFGAARKKCRKKYRKLAIAIQLGWTRPPFNVCLANAYILFG